MGPLHNKQALLFIHYYCVSGDHLVHAGFPPVEIFFSLMSAPLRHPTT